MTHSLHRFAREDIFSHEGGEVPWDFVVMVMACQGQNDDGAEGGLRRALDILASRDPINLSDGEGSLFTGETTQSLRDAMVPTSYVAGVYSDPDDLSDVLEELKAADLGLSVVITGDPDDLQRPLSRVDLEAHTVNLSLGTHGDTEKLPRDEILGMALMCGHGLVAPGYIAAISGDVRKGLLDARAGAEKLAALCTCGIFNVAVAAALLGRDDGR